MRLIGLTGGIGSGKSTVTAYLKKKRIPIIDADIIAHQVVCKGSPCLKKIIETFGPEVRAKRGDLNRKALASLIFASARKRHCLEKIIHPAIREEILKQVAAYRKMKKKLVVLVAPLLFEVGLYRKVDFSVLVTAPMSVRKRRIARHLHGRMKAQMSDEHKKALADYVIDNSGRRTATFKQVDRLLKLFL